MLNVESLSASKSVLMPFTSPFEIRRLYRIFSSGAVATFFCSRRVRLLDLIILSSLSDVLRVKYLNPDSWCFEVEHHRNLRVLLIVSQGLCRELRHLLAGALVWEGLEMIESDWSLVMVPYWNLWIWENDVAPWDVFTNLWVSSFDWLIFFSMWL